MNAPHTQILAVLTVTAGLLFAMVWLAARMSMIELRRPERCPCLRPPAPRRVVRL